jgi:catechol 2,3-dioxygenase-like lactoylglutathione lyase family enzyme
MMRFHHVCLIVSDLDRSIAMFTKLFDFKVDVDVTAPDDALAATPDSSFPQLMKDIWKIPAPRTRVALLSSPGGALIELQESLDPKIKQLPEEYHSYHYTGMRELAFRVDDIDGWFDKVKQAGFEPQTPYVWSFGDSARSFAFFDDDHHIIQLWESPAQQGWG